MILFCGIPSEPPLALAIEAAEELGIEHVIFNQRHSHFYDMMLDLRDGRPTGALWACEREWPLEQFTGIYTRMIDSSDVPENRSRGHIHPDHSLISKSAFLHHMVNDWIEIAESRVVNRATAMSSNVSKPYQAQLIQKSGFQVPPTLITNDPQEVHEFVRLHKRLIYKSISSVRSIVRELSNPSREQLERIRHLPTQFQGYISGVNIRVHVVGEAVFATEIISEAVDYRYAERDGVEVTMSPVLLPDDIAARCLLLSRQLRLPFCGIDLKRTAEGDYYCFEVNPSPGYSYYQEHTAQPIAQALVQYLISRDSLNTHRVPYASRRELG